MRNLTVSIRQVTSRANKSKIVRALVLVTVLIVQAMPATATATDSLITTFYWDGGWVEHASWTTTLGEDLNIQILAWNYEPGFPSLHVQFDNVITGNGLLDDFDDGIINDSIWETHAHISEGVTLEETGGVLDVDIPPGPPSQGNGVCGGATTREHLLHGNFGLVQSWVTIGAH